LRPVERAEVHGLGKLANALRGGLRLLAIGPGLGRRQLGNRLSVPRDHNCFSARDPIEQRRKTPHCFDGIDFGHQLSLKKISHVLPG